jgi:undecaprenyl-diphosphatase
MKLAPFPWDEKVFAAVNGRTTDFLDYFFGWPTHFGDPAVLLFTVGVFMLIWDDGRLFRKFFTVVAATYGGLMIAHAFKAALVRPRPYVYYREMIETGQVQINALFGLLASESAFPSGHTTLVFSCVTALNCIYKKRLWPLYFFAVYIAFTRVYVGVHFPSDVIAGAVIGTLSGYGIYRVCFWGPPAKENFPI